VERTHALKAFGPVRVGRTNFCVLGDYEGQRHRPLEMGYDGFKVDAAVCIIGAK
jgi:hypothetical protein